MTPSNATAVAALLAALVLLASLLPAQEPPPPEQTLRVEVGVVNVYCTVKEKGGRLVPDLNAEDFEIREDGKPQELRFFDRETDRPLTLALLVDTSVSQRQVLPAEQEAAAAFLRQVLRPREDMALLITFDVNVDLLQDFTQDPMRLENALYRAQINAPVGLGPFPRSGPAGTRFYDAIYLASKEKLGHEVGRKAIIVVSDGVDAGSQVDRDEALAAAHRGQAIIYSIGISDPDFYGRDFGRAGAGRSILKKMAEKPAGALTFRAV